MKFAEAKADRLTLVFIGVYTVVFSCFTTYMHYAFKTYAWDLGIFTQALWTTVNLGKPFYYTIELQVNTSGNFLGTHFSPILFLIIPIYAIYQSPLTLLVIQSFILALGALPIYRMAKEKLNDTLSGLGIAAAYLLYPALHSVNCFDFHTESFIPVLFLSSFYYFDKGKWFKGTFFAALMLSTIEFAPIIVAFLAIYLIIKNSLGKKSWRDREFIKGVLQGIVLIILAISWFFLAFDIMHSINPLKEKGLPGNWDYWGSNLSEVFVNILTNPVKALSFMVTPIEKLYYVLALLSPLLMLPVYSLEFLCALPWPIAAMLSNYQFYYNFYFQYSAFAIGQLFIATIFSIKKIFLSVNQGSQKKLQRKLVTLLILVNVILCIAISPIGLPQFSTRKIEITPHANLLHEILKLIPDNASIATQNDIFPHVAQREHAYILTWPMPTDVDYILVDLKSCHFIVFGGAISTESPNEALKKIVNSGNYGLLATADGILLLKKYYVGPIQSFVPRIEVFTSTDLIPVSRSSKVITDKTCYSGTVIVHEPTDLPGFVWYGPYRYFFSGEYSATFRVKTKSENISLIIDVADAGNVISERKLNFTDFETLDKWQEFTINFKIEGLRLLEFRGICESNNTYVALDYVRVMQLGP